MVSHLQAQLNDPYPLEYVLEGTLFCGEWFVVRPSVLIPRLETELLVEYTIRKAKIQNPKSETITILDLGTGSGNISIMLAKKLDCKVYAVDISDAALKIAKENAILHRVDNKIEFHKSDWYKDLAIDPVDIIVSNPPYIAEGEWDSLPVEVKDYEPRMALFAGEDGLNSYKDIISGAQKMLVSGGRIVLEIGHKQAKSVKKILDGFKEVEIIKDHFGNDRIITGIKWTN
jgi:release factor glutamine methyltransferase